MNIIKKIWLYMAKKKIIEKYNQLECDKTLDLFNNTYRAYERDMFGINTNLVQILREIDLGCIEREWYEHRLKYLISNLEDLKGKFVRLFKQYRHCVRMYHWMYTHGHHNKYAKMIFDDGLTFKKCYESRIEKYLMEFEPFDISLELKKYKIYKRKKELENDFNS
jgi:hypothetical protein